MAMGDSTWPMELYMKASLSKDISMAKGNLCILMYIFVYPGRLLQSYLGLWQNGFRIVLLQRQPTIWITWQMETLHRRRQKILLIIFEWYKTCRKDSANKRWKTISDSERNLWHRRWLLWAYKEHHIHLWWWDFTNPSRRWSKIHYEQMQICAKVSAHRWRKG